MVLLHINDKNYDNDNDNSMIYYDDMMLITIHTKSKYNLVNKQEKIKLLSEQGKRKTFMIIRNR